MYTAKRRSMSVGIFLTLIEKFASAQKYRCSTSPESIQGIIFSTGNGGVPPTPIDLREGMQTTVTSSLDTMSALSITTLALTPSTTRAIRLEHPSQGRTMIPQANDNKSLTHIRTHQVDKDPDTYSKEAHICRGTSRRMPTAPSLLTNFFSHTP